MRSRKDRIFQETLSANRKPDPKANPLAPLFNQLRPFESSQCHCKAIPATNATDHLLPLPHPQPDTHSFQGTHHSKHLGFDGWLWGVMTGPSFPFWGGVTRWKLAACVRQPENKRRVYIHTFSFLQTSDSLMSKSAMLKISDVPGLAQR